MQVHETTLQQLISGVKQFRVPIFQRPYTWKRSDHAQLWSDILSQYEALLPGAPMERARSNHFLGSFVLSPAPGNSAVLPKFIVVDGQQRLTTLMLALCALRDTWGTNSPEIVERFDYAYLVNKFNTGEDYPRLLPGLADRASFNQHLLAGPGRGGEDLIGQTYRFFLGALQEPGPDDQPLDFGVLEQAIIGRLEIVDITTSPDDNVHRIFESLNATGVGLTQADLLRNYLFMLLPTRQSEVYESVWQPMEHHIGPDNLEGLARVDLMRRGIDVRSGDVYREQQARFAPWEGDEDQVVRQIEDLAERASQYAKILQPHLESHSEVRDRLTFLRRWEAQTTHPVIMCLYDLRDRGMCTAGEMADALHNIESFLVRRLVTGVSTRNLNRIFLALAKQLHDEEPSAVVETVRLSLSGERKYWASDDEIREAAHTRPLYYFGRGTQQRLLFERLEQSYGNKELGELATMKLSIEHILPQALTSEWIKELRFEDPTPPEMTHAELLHTLGNLTITGYNPELSNKPLRRKQQIFEKSHLEINGELPQLAHWNRKAILKRADELADRVMATWPAPILGVAGVPVGFDWSDLHAILAAIPAGKWTTYADLAQVVGTSPLPVGTHIANNDVVNGHRVMAAGGKISSGFHWADASDKRDPIAVLQEEGVVFDAQGVASPSQRLDSDALEALRADNRVEDELTLTQRRRVSFFSQCVEAMGARMSREYSNPSGYRAYYQVQTGLSGVHYEWCFHRGAKFGVELHFERQTQEQNRVLLDACLAAVRDDLAVVLGELVVQPDWGSSSRLYLVRGYGELDGELSEWAVDNMVKLIETVQPVLDDIASR